MYPKSFSDNVLRLLLGLMIVLAFYHNIYAVPLFDLDEGAFSEATREMFERDDFISTYLNGEPRYDKPILVYWLQAASMALFGVNEFAFRLPSALAATAWVLMLAAFMARIKDHRAGLLAGVFAAGSLLISIIGKAATADALLNCLLAGSMFAVFLYWREGRKRYQYALYVFCALGFLTKGPVALLVPGVVSLIFFVTYGEFRSWLKLAFNPLGILLFLAIAMPWYVAQYLKEGQAFIDGFFLKHNVSRFSGPMEGHAGSLFYYVPVFLAGALPFTALAVAGLARGRSLWQDFAGRYALIWFLFVLVFFTLSGTKLPHYINYGMTGLVILMVLVADQLRSRVWALLPPLLFFVTLIFLPQLMKEGVEKEKDAYFQAALANYENAFGWEYRLFLVAAALLCVFFIWERRRALVDKLVVVAFASLFTISGLLLPIMGKLIQQPVKEAALLARQNQWPVVMWKLNMPSFSVYYQHSLERRAPRAGEVVFTAPRYLAELPAYDLLYREGGVVLARVRDVAAAPAAPGPSTAE